MAQEFHVVRCFKCETFQVQQVKKANGWSCRLCGEKQSLLKEFGRGSGADCRRHVQKLNAMRGSILEEQDHRVSSLWQQAEEQNHHMNQSHLSRWSKYVDPPEKAEPQEVYSNSVIDRRRRSHTPEETQRSSLDSVVTPHTSRATSPVSRCAAFLPSDCKEVKGTIRPHPLHHVSSMFESGDDFSIDDCLTE